MSRPIRRKSFGRKRLNTRVSRRNKRTSTRSKNASRRSSGKSRRRIRGGNGFDQFNNSGGVVTGFGTFSGIGQGVSTLFGNNHFSTSPSIQPIGSNYLKPMI